MSASTSYCTETPWLCWSDWTKVQQYKKPNPMWIAMCLSLFDDPEYAAVWKPGGHTRLGLILHLMGVFGRCSVSGIIFGSPEYLQGELDLPSPPDLSWLLEAGWVRYISLAEKKEIENALTAAKKKPTKTAPARKKGSGRGSGSAGSVAPVSSNGIGVAGKDAVVWLRDLLRAGAVSDSDVKARVAEAGYSRRTIQNTKAELGVELCRRGRRWAWQLPAKQVRQSANQPDQDGQPQRDHLSSEMPFLALRTECDHQTGIETGTETETVTEPSGTPLTNNASIAAIAAPPETEKRQKQAQPEDRQRLQDSTGPDKALSLVSDLPQPISAVLGLPAGSAALPPESDLRGKGPPVGGNPSPGSLRRRAGPGILGDCLGPLALARRCPEVWDWVSSVFKLLRFGFEIDSVEGRRETGSFATVYNKVMLSPLLLGEKTRILVSSLKTAEQKGRKPDGYYRKGKGAVFCDVLNRRLKCHLAANSAITNEDRGPPKTIQGLMHAVG